MCVFQTSLHMKIKLNLRKYEWVSILLLSEVSISALPSHSCLHVQELHYYKNVSIILMFTYEVHEV